MALYFLIFLRDKAKKGKAVPYSSEELRRGAYLPLVSCEPLGG